MYTHPELMFVQAREHQRELEAAADQYRLLSAARAGRRARRRSARAGSAAAVGRSARRQPTGNLAECATSAA